DTDRAQRWDVPVRRKRVSGSGRITKIGNPQFLILQVHSETRWVTDERAGAFYNSPRCHVASVLRTEDQYRLAYAVRNVDFGLVGIHKHCSRPIQLSPRSLNHT